MSKKAELYLTSIEQILSQKEWIKENKPYMFVLKYDKNNIKIWSDHAYGKLKMKINNESIISKGSVRIGEYIVFDETYGGIAEPYKPYKLQP